jgi:hypothetical protein
MGEHGRVGPTASSSPVAGSDRPEPRSSCAVGAVVVAVIAINAATIGVWVLTHGS